MIVEFPGITPNQKRFHMPVITASIVAMHPPPMLQARQAKKEADAAAKNSASAFKGFKQWKFGDPHPTHPTTPSPEVSRYHGFWRKKSTTHPTWVPFKMPNSLGKI